MSKSHENDDICSRVVFSLLTFLINRKFDQKDVGFILNEFPISLKFSSMYCLLSETSYLVIFFLNESIRMRKELGDWYGE